MIDQDVRDFLDMVNAAPGPGLHEGTPQRAREMASQAIGFGELPRPFSDAQRLWVTGIIYLSVIGWAYFLGRLLTLVQDRGFRLALVTERFRRDVRALRES